MEAIKPNPILQFNENQLHNVRKALGYGHIEKLKQDIELLRDWIKKQNHFKIKDFEEEFLERLLIYNKGSIERTKQKFDKLCTFTNLMPEFLQNYDIKNEFEATHKISKSFILPRPTEDNYRIIGTHLPGVDVKEFLMIQYYRYLIVFGHYMLHHDYCHGFEWVIDTRRITVNNVTKMNPMVVHKALTLIVEAMGLRLKKIHILSGSTLFETVLRLFKQGLSAKLKERVIVHSNVESLHEHIPKEFLSNELGGDEKSAADLNDIIFKELSTDEHINHVKFMESLGTDETSRLPGKFNEDYSGMPGSFKTLCVD